MKKLYLFLLLSSISFISFGQFKTFTPKAGITLSNARNFIFEKEYYKPGFMTGVASEYLISSKLSLVPELIFEQKGTLQKVDGVDANGHSVGIVKMYYAWNYIGVPMLVKYKPFAKHQIYLQGGGYADFLISETRRLKYTEDGIDHDEKDNTDISGYGKWDIGVLAGGGIDIPVGKRNALQIDARYAFAFNLGGATMPPATVTFTLSAGYLFYIGK